MKQISLFILTLVVNSTYCQLLQPDSSRSIPDNLKETSGLIWNGKNFISMNDSGHPNLLTEFDRKGVFVKNYTIEDARNVDWEEITADDQGNFYIGDFGNNIHKRKNLCVYKVDLKQDRIKAEKIEFSFEDQRGFPPAESNLNFDCEAMIWYEGKLYLFSKNNAKPYLGYTKVYQLNDDPGMNTAKLMDSVFLGKGGFLEHSVTSAAFDYVHHRLALQTYQHLYLFYDFEGDRFFEGKIMHFPMGVTRQREAILFDKSGDLWGTDEYRMGIGGNLYYYSLTKWLRGENEYNKGEINDVMVRLTENILSVNFRTNLIGDYSLEIRGGVGASFQLYEQAKVKTKTNEGKEILFGKISIPGNIEKQDAVLCIYNGNRLIFCRSFKKIIK